jgi:serine phosphatase RsbU (regulator of sigma subunit)
MLTVLAKNSPALPEALIQAVGRDVAAHVGNTPQSDDITMMSIVYFGKNKDSFISQGGGGLG